MSKERPIVTLWKRVEDVTPSYVGGSGRWSAGRTGKVLSIFRGDRVHVLYDADKFNPPKDFWIPYEYLRFV